MKNTYLLLCTFFCTLSFGQDLEKEIDTVFIFDRSLSKSEKFQKTTKFNSEEIRRNSNSLSELLEFQSSIYIKENGRGMSSSPSFRGTTAQQTAVLWNGININSSFLGQSDLNNISTLDYNQISIKSGGGSLAYGSNAIGGTVHLNNILSYNKGFEGTLFAEYGSFETLNNNLNASYSNEKFAINFSGSFSKSENDYEVEEKNFVSDNAKYSKKSFNLGLGYKIHKNHELIWQSQQYFGNQHFMIFSATDNKTKYDTRNYRSLLGWYFHQNKIKNNLKVAYLQEEYAYFFDLNSSKTTGETSKQWIMKNEFDYLFSEKISTSLNTEFINNNAEGFQSGIDETKRNSFSLALVVRHNPLSHFTHEFSFKKDFVEDISSPFLFSYGANINIFKFYNLKLHASKNFRYPSFNDLYSQYGGNPDLDPETSNQIELTNELKWGNFKLQITPFYIDIKDMIRWVPDASGMIWLPQNTHKVKSYGLESSVDWKQNFNNHNISVSLGHSYNISENTETNKQLIYAPIHKINAGFNYSYKFVNLFVQSIYNGLTYTKADESAELDHFFILNTGINISADKENKYTIGFKVNNLTNKVYETVANYPLPKRNYSINLRISF